MCQVPVQAFIGYQHEWASRDWGIIGVQEERGANVVLGLIEMF